jgi:molecular chaperone GrpE (heat shock protein)
MLHAQVRALQLRCATANDECSRAQAEMKNLQTLAAQEVSEALSF